MALRPGEIYVKRKTKRRLRWITKIEKTRDAQPDLTEDEIGDRMLNERIEQVYPNIKELEKEFDAKEDEIIGKLSE